MQDRRKLRKILLSRRDGLPESELREKSVQIRNRVLAMEEVRGSSVIMAYVSYRSEVETQPLIAGLQEACKTVAVPLTDPERFSLIPYILDKGRNGLIPGYCSIPEPDPERLVRLEPAELDIVLVPGSVFDPAGGRLGYGGGYYDRFLSRSAPQALTVGLAFELQVVDEVPLEEHDVPLDWVITEERIIKGRGGTAIHSF